MIDVYTLVTTLIATLLFPGLVFIVALALFTEWYIRKAVAHMQSRVGPRYVGFLGLLQPLADLLKLASVKEEIKQKYSLTWLAKVFGVLGIGAMVASLTLLPLSPIRFTSAYDYLVYIYLMGVWVPIAVTVMSLSMPNPFTNVGLSRFLTFLVVTEPAYFAALLVPFTLAVREGVAPVYSVYSTSRMVWGLWYNPLYAVLLVVALIASIVSVQAKTMLNPFNIPEAEQEIIAGFATEFSGPVLAVYNLLHDIDVAVSALFIVYLFLGGPAPFPHLSIWGMLLLIVKYIVVVTVISAIRASYGRFRIDQALAVVAKYSLIPGVLAAVAANLLLLL